MTELPKVYDPAAVESRWYATWLAADYFAADARAAKTPYSIVIPPPNVTGSLHMGHALMLTIQDVLVRYRRMQGSNALWLPGTDHAGIATQLMVERLLQRTENKSRHDLGREEFLKRVWAWKAKYGDRIGEQMKVLGCSLDWQRARFTMDDGFSAAVREVFVRLHEEGLIYRAERLINWCTRCRTALSDLEVENQEEQGQIWHIAYPVVGTSERLTVATTRPETMLGDTAIAVHPDDPRYKHLVGKRAELPLTGRTIPIVADAELVSMEFGTGAVKVTPGHDFNDFETGVRHKLELLSVISLEGTIIAPAPAKFIGLDVDAARKAVVAELEAGGFLVEVKPHALARGRCDRCRTVVEPLVSKQWFVKTEPLAKPAIEAVETGKTKFIPENWTKVYMHWMTNIKDWCISRQLWWGHRIPAWTCTKCEEITVARQDPTACPKCQGTTLTQDEDVLDTWFSSALWPFATLGWPEQTRELKTFYPTSVMETGHDILFFWVARMMMMGLHFMKKVPFRTVYLHGLVVDENGDKMSKTKGNVIDPLDVVNGATKEAMIAQAKADGLPDAAQKAIGKVYPEGMTACGADALRFTLAWMAAQGRNLRLSMASVEGNRAFANKLWNASRFALMNLEGVDPDAYADTLEDVKAFAVADRWVLSRLQRTTHAVTEALDAFRLNDAAQAIYHFVWNDVCDWYIELAKPSLQGTDPAAKKRVQGTLAHVLEAACRLLHPFMPFVTEEIWQKLPKQTSAPQSIMITMYPNVDERLVDEAAEREMGLLMEVSVAVRALRSLYNVAPSAFVNVHAKAGGERKEILTGGLAIVERAARAKFSFDTSAPAGTASAKQVVAGDVELELPLEGLIDLAAERARLEKEIQRAKKDAEGLEKKLENPAFVSKAPAEVVDEQRARLAETRGRLSRLEEARGQL